MTRGRHDSDDDAFDLEAPDPHEWTDDDASEDVVACAACGAAVWEHAPACPACGAALVSGERGRWGRIVQLLAISLLLALLLSFVCR